jgi:streptomycin 6-kinase
VSCLNQKLTKEIVDMNTSIPIDVPDALIASQCKHGGAWIASLPGLIAKILDRWTLRLDV